MEESELTAGKAGKHAKAVILQILQMFFHQLQLHIRN